jgi:hypothetical protein
VTFITACDHQTVQSYTPSTFSSGKQSSLFRRHATPDVTLPPCSTKAYFAPGTFTVLTALGSFDGGNFTGSGLSLWANLKAPKGVNQLPYKAPNLGVPYTIYYGTYKLSGGMIGCFFLAKINYQGISFDGAVAAWPNVYSYGIAKPSAEGPLAITVKGISPKAGSGTLTLKDPSGETIETGTVSIKGSKHIK